MTQIEDFVTQRGRATIEQLTQLIKRSKSCVSGLISNSTRLERLNDEVYLSPLVKSEYGVVPLKELKMLRKEKVPCLKLIELRKQEIHRGILFNLDNKTIPRLGKKTGVGSKMF